MTIKKAMSIIFKVIDRAMQEYAFEYNSYEVWRDPSAWRGWRKYVELRQAKEILQKWYEEHPK